MGTHDELDFYTDKMYEVLDLFKIDGKFTRNGCRANVFEWLEQKQSLINILRKHPNWNEKAKAVIVPLEINKEQNPVKLANAYRSFKGYVYGLAPWSSETRECINFMSSLVLYPTVVDEWQAKTMTKLMHDLGMDEECAVGTKMSRVINKLCKNLVNEEGIKVDITKDPEYDKHFARLSGAMSVKVQKLLGVLSVSILDFLTMSNGNSWSSCHFINKHNLFHEDCGNATYSGCYQAGTLSYSNDRVTMCFYTVNAKSDIENIHLVPKIDRQIFFYVDKHLFQSRLYPDEENYEKAELFMFTVERVLSVCLGINDIDWCYSDYCNPTLKTYDNAFHYEDYSDEHYIDECGYAVVEGEEEYYSMTIGGKSYCVACGEERTYYEKGQPVEARLQCYECSCDTHCHKCGKPVSTSAVNDYYEINGKLYCRDCTVWCSYHSRREVNDEHMRILYYISPMPNSEKKRYYPSGHSICDTALLSDKYFVCEGCGNVFYSEYRVDGTNKCIVCAEKQKEAQNGD